MMIKFLARGTGSAAAAADYLTREQNLAPEQDQDQDQDRRTTSRSPKYCAGFERDLEAAATGAGTAARAGARLWPQPLGLVLLEGVTEWAERIGRKYEH